MDSRAADSRGEDKVQLILGQVALIRTRLNALALQKGLFGALTFVLSAAVLIVGAAFLFSPLTFLMVGLAASAAAIAGITRLSRAAWRMRSGDERAARIADERAALKGRLTTMVDGAQVGQKSALWPYLVEDTLALREEFVPAKIEPRRFSPWLWTALASCAIAALVMRLAYGVRISRLTASNHIVGVPGEPSADLGDLDIRPADPSAQPGTEIDADPATLRKLAEKLREVQRAQHSGGPTSRLMANARDAARSLQNKLTGGKPSATASRLKLTDRKGGDTAKQPADSKKDSQANTTQDNSGAPSGQHSDQDQSQPNSASTPTVPDMSGLAALNGLNNDDPSNSGSTPQNTPPQARKAPPGGPLGAGGSDHGSGSDPQHLYGDAEPPPLGNDTFKIPVEVGPSDEGSSNSAPASPPQRTKSALNASQAPDEPFERASIPASDRVTIKRVFER